MECLAYLHLTHIPSSSRSKTETLEEIEECHRGASINTCLSARSPICLDATSPATHGHRLRPYLHQATIQITALAGSRGFSPAVRPRKKISVQETRHLDTFHSKTSTITDISVPRYHTLHTVLHKAQGRVKGESSRVKMVAILATNAGQQENNTARSPSFWRWLVAHMTRAFYQTPCQRHMHE